jgi:hypothetical protein
MVNDLFVRGGLLASPGFVSCNNRGFIMISSTPKKLAPLLTLSVIGLAVLSFSVSAQVQRWNLDYSLPINAKNYPRAQEGSNKFAINTAYEVKRPIPRGQALRLKVLIPPGTSLAKISAQSNDWQCGPDLKNAAGQIIVPSIKRCPIMAGFDRDSGALCTTNPTANKPTPCGPGPFVYPKDLHTVTARLLDILYPTSPNSPQVATEASYAYFVFYNQPQTSEKFEFSSHLGISFGISDVKRYNQWVDTGRGQKQPQQDNRAKKPPVKVDVVVNQSIYKMGEQLKFTIQTASYPNNSDLYDLYAALVFPEGFFVTISPPLKFSAPKALQVYRSGLKLAGRQSFSILDWQIPTGLTLGNYKCCGVVTPANSDPSQGENWLHIDCQDIELR